MLCSPGIINGLICNLFCLKYLVNTLKRAFQSWFALEWRPNRAKAKSHWPNRAKRCLNSPRFLWDMLSLFSKATERLLVVGVPLNIKHGDQIWSRPARSRVCPSYCPIRNICFLAMDYWSPVVVIYVPSKLYLATNSINIVRLLDCWLITIVKCFIRQICFQYPMNSCWFEGFWFCI